MNFDRIMQILGGLALLISLVFIAYELRISNRLAEMEALNRGYEGSSIIRSEMLTYADLWVKAVDGSPLSDIEEERIRLLCGGLVSNVNNNLTNKVVQQLFDVNMAIDLNNYLNSDMLSTTKKNRISRFYVDLNGELKEKGDNLWGLFSGVTKYTTHSLSKTDNSEKKLFGLYGKKERQIFQDISSLVY